MAAAAPVPLGEYVPTADQRVVLNGVTWAKRGLDLSPYGSWTLKAATKNAGVEPGECFLVGSDQSRETPDLAIEVVWTSGGIDKLEAYRRLGVREAWFWKNDRIQIYLPEDGAYRVSTASACLVGLDLALLQSMLDQPTAIQAVRAFRAALGSSR